MKRPGPWHLTEDPPFYSEGLEWVLRGDPPIAKKFLNGEIVELPWIRQTVEVVVPPSETTTGPVSSTFPISAALDDQFVYKYGTTYPPTGSVYRATTEEMLIVGRLASAGVYWVYNTLLKFPTATLPDTATMQSAYLEVYPRQVANANNLSLTAEWYAWNGTDSDYATTPGTLAMADFPLANLTAYTVNQLPLVNVTNVSATAYTYLRLTLSTRAGDAPPTGDNYVWLANYESAQYPEARLIVTYT